VNHTIWVSDLAMVQGPLCSRLFVLSQSQILLQDAALVKGGGDPVDIPVDIVGDAEVVNDCNCWKRDGHSVLATRVARMSGLAEVVMAQATFHFGDTRGDLESDGF